jgi:hypothetical protein
MVGVLAYAFFAGGTAGTPAYAPAVAPAEAGNLPPLYQATDTPTTTPTPNIGQTVTALALHQTQTAVAAQQTSIAATQTAVSQPTTTAIYVDQQEPNNSLQDATTIAANANPTCALTLWPAGDLDYFRFVAKAGASYEVLTLNLSPGLDTVLTLYDSQGNQIAENDDYQFNSLASKVSFAPSGDGYYYARVTNTGPGDPANKTYCIEVNELTPTATATPLPTGTRVPGADACEPNPAFEAACLIGAGDSYDLNFVPLIGEGPDNDFFRLWMKAGLSYTCETFSLGSVNDTNMILYDQNKNGIAGNDDKAPGDKGSLVSFSSPYTGWLYVLVGPHAPPEYALSYLYTYSLRCTEALTAPTPTATIRPPSGGGQPSPPTPTPFRTPTPGADLTLTPGAFATPSPTPRPVVVIVPLPSPTPAAGSGQQSINLGITVYFDANLDYVPELTEGVEDVAVSLYDSATNELLAFGYTNEAGALRFGPLLVAGPIRIAIPFLQYSQVVGGDADIVIRIAPALPANAP